MERRKFIQSTIMGSFAIGLSSFINPGKTHILTLSFDDGFKKSFYQIADIFEEFGLHACFNVIASGHLPSFQKVDNWILPELLGNFDDWNILQKRGHEVMPHSWAHRNLTNLPLEKSKELISTCLDYFEKHLEGYKASNAVYNFAFNASTPELEQFALTKVRAIRTFGEAPFNSIPRSGWPVRIGCWSYGPKNVDNWVEQKVNKFLVSSGGWLVLNLHGLDDEGWGPLSTTYLTGLLKRLKNIEYLEILPAGEVLI